MFTVLIATVNASSIYEGIDQARDKLDFKFDGCTARIG